MGQERAAPAVPDTMTRDDGRPSPGARLLLLAFAGLTLLATCLLLGLAPRTDTLFAWTIQPPLSAAFLGAGYGAGFVMSVLAYRSRSWAEARVAMVAVLIFTVLTLIATVNHLHRFHFGAAGIALLAAWIWLLVYVVVPLALFVVVVRERRVHPPSPRSSRALPRWLAVLLAAQGGLMAVVGVVLFVAPSLGAALWPWPLTPLTAQMAAAWLVALGLAAALSLREPVPARLRVLTIAYCVFGVLQLVALAAYGGAVDWSSPGAAVYVVTLVAVLVTGCAGLAAAVGHRRAGEQS